MNNLKICSHPHSAAEHPHKTEHASKAAQDTTPLSVTEPGTVLTRIRIGQMDCPTEAALLRKKLNAMATVRQLHFDLIHRVLTVIHVDRALEQVLNAIRTLGMTPEVLTGRSPGTPSAASAASHRPTWLLLGGAGLLAALAELSHFLGAAAPLSAAFAIASILCCGLTTYRKGWIAVRHGNLNINALMSIAVTGAAAIGQWPEAAMVMFLFNVAEYIEALSLNRARLSIRSLLTLTPTTATQRQADGSWQEVPVESLVVGDIVRVRPGERIAADGIVITGNSSVDQSPITGESLPVDKAQGAPVYAATINAEGSFEYQVTAAAHNTTLARIIHAVEQATASRVPMQRFIDRFSHFYTPIMVGAAILTASIPPLFWSVPWLEAIYRALVLLIIACPCALVISTPVSIVSALTAASRRGILIKGGISLENGRKLRWLAFDKTGTLTHGKPILTDLVILDPAPNHAPSASVRASALPTIAEIAVSLAARSDHPVSRAIATAHPKWVRHEVRDFSALPGRGITGYVADQKYYLGNRRLVQELGMANDDLTQQVDALEAQGKTVVTLCDEKNVLAIAAVADTLRPLAARAIQKLHALGVKTFMLSGDNTATVQAIASQLGITHARGEQLPQHKLSALESRMGDGLVGMVGDGINDAPALARADIGFAMAAAGTDTAIETADVALMDDDLGKISEFIKLSRNTHHVLVQNITLALAIKAVFLALTLAGAATLWMAVFADVGASLLVVANGLRLTKINHH